MTRAYLAGASLGGTDVEVRVRLPRRPWDGHHARRAVEGHGGVGSLVRIARHRPRGWWQSLRRSGNGPARRWVDRWRIGGAYRVQHRRRTRPRRSRRARQGLSAAWRRRERRRLLGVADVARSTRCNPNGPEPAAEPFAWRATPFGPREACLSGVSWHLRHLQRRQAC